MIDWEMKAVMGKKKDEGGMKAKRSWARGKHVTMYPDPYHNSSFILSYLFEAINKGFLVPLWVK
jgi:hypothetical protein